MHTKTLHAFHYLSSVAAKLVFDKCVQKDKIEDRRGSYYFKVNYNYDYVEDFRNLYRDQGPKISAADQRHEEESSLRNPSSMHATSIYWLVMPCNAFKMLSIYPFCISSSSTEA